MVKIEVTMVVNDNRLGKRLGAKSHVFSCGHEKHDLSALVS